MVRIIFMGTPELACVSLHALVQSGRYTLAAAVCQPDQPKGRGLKPQPPPVKQLAVREGIPVLQPARARESSFVGQLAQLAPDLIVVAAYGQILPQNILDLPPHGCLNVHTSLLPKYRGAAPIQWAILNDEPETGVTIMKMNAGLDTGEIVAQEKTPILPTDNSETLHERLARLGADLLLRIIPDYVTERIQPRPQPVEGVSYAPKIRKQDGQMDWTQPARGLWNRVRAMAPWPGAFTWLPGPKGRHLLKIWEAEPDPAAGSPGRVITADKNGIVVACGTGSLRIRTLQPEASRRMSAAEFLSGHALLPGHSFPPTSPSL